jgi:YidC/Oxa1 family membrane protein insertase
MAMERRVLVAVFLSFLVLYGYQSFVVPPSPATTGESAPPAAAAPASAVVTPPAPPENPTPAAPAAPTPATVLGDATAREVVVETATVQATLSNRGGRIIHWRLRDYRDGQGQPVDLVPSALPLDQPTPFSLRVDDQRSRQRRSRRSDACL